MINLDIFKFFTVYFVFQMVASYLFLLKNGLGTFIVMYYLMFLLLIGFYRLKKNKNDSNKRLVETVLMASIGGLAVSFVVSLPSFIDFIFLILIYFLPLSCLLYLVTSKRSLRE